MDGRRARGAEELYYYHYLGSQRRLGGYAPLTQLWRMDGMGGMMMGKRKRRDEVRKTGW